MTPGGKGANQAVAAAKLGAEVKFIARLGDDIFAQHSLSNFKKETVSTKYVTVANRAHWHRVMKKYIKRNNPVMLNVMKGTKIYGVGKTDEGHSMPVIGYKREYYNKGMCYKRAMPEKKWLLVDTTWLSRGYVRFDGRGNYFKGESVVFVRVY